MEKLISIGYTKKANGVNGEIKVAIEEQYLEDYFHATILFLKIQGKNVPYFVEKHTISNAPLIKFEDVNNRDDATPLTGKEIFLREKDLIPDEEREYEMEELLEFKKYEGYLIVDKTMGEIGKIEEVVEYPQQEMAVVLYQENEVLIPLHEDLILEIDDGAQRILVELPEGLLDL